MAAPQPGPEPFAADGPGFPVAVDQEIDKCGARVCMKELGRNCIGDEHISRYRGPCCRSVENSKPNRIVEFARSHRPAIAPPPRVSASKACGQTSFDRCRR